MRAYAVRTHGDWVPVSLWGNDACARLIQSAWRGHAARKMVDSLMMDNLLDDDAEFAAIMLQCAIRGFKARRVVEKRRNRALANPDAVARAWGDRVHEIRSMEGSR
jgi:hypothetical protein